MGGNPSGNILVIKLGALGDFIQALGPMAAIRKNHSHSRITLLTTKPFEDIARKCGYADDVLLDSRPQWHDIKGWLQLRRILNAGRFSRVYDLQNNDRTSFYFKLFSPRPEWVGIAKGASHRNVSPFRTAGLAFDGHAQTLSLAGIPDVPVDRLEWMKGDFDTGMLKRPYVLIVPGSAANRTEKRWPKDHFIALCGMLVKKGYTPILIGTKEEAPILDGIADAIHESVNLCGKTSIYDLAALARNAAGAIGNDTGPMHIIAPTSCPSVVLFSKGSNPVRHAPLGDHVSTLQEGNLQDLKPENVWTAFQAQLA